MNAQEIDPNTVVMFMETLLDGPLDLLKLENMILLLNELPKGWETDPFNQKLSGEQEYASFLEFICKEKDKLTDYRVRIAQELEDLVFHKGGRISTILSKLRTFQGVVEPMYNYNYNRMYIYN